MARSSFDATGPSHDDHGGLARDLAALGSRLAERRRVLQWMAGASLVPLVGCGDDAAPSTTPAPASDAGTGAGEETCSKIPGETAGPYPGDGTNGANALTLSGIVRSDLRSSLAGATGVAEGVALTLTLKVVDAAACGALAGRAVYLWHCTREGLYSLYSQGVAGESFLRGVQETNASGEVTFTTIFPGCYDGRMPHMHFEVFADLASATSGRNAVATSQIAFPVADCNAVYATAGYAASVTNLAKISFATDNVFSDGEDAQLATLSGSAAAGYAGRLVVGV